MTKNMNKGDLVWIPQHTRLHWLREDSEKRYLVTDAPRAAVIYDEKDRSYDVFFDGNLWTINKAYTYPMGGRSAG
jgi:hypothetical protein